MGSHFVEVVKLGVVFWEDLLEVFVLEEFEGFVFGGDLVCDMLIEELFDARKWG